MIKVEYIWGRIDNAWVILRKLNEVYVNAKHEYCLPSEVDQLELMPGMVWRHRLGTTTIKIVDQGYIYYYMDKKSSIRCYHA